MKNVILLLLIIMIGALTANAQVSVIVNKSVTESSLDAAKLKDIYSLKLKKWASGEKIVVFNLKKKGAAQNGFYGYLGVKLTGLKKVWMKAQLTGEAKAPKSFGSEDDVLNKVAATNGAIGFVSSDKVTDAVKVVATIN